MNENVYNYEGFAIPEILMNMTGGGISTWDAISKGHMWQYSKYCPIEPNHTVLEIGCGVGRDAIQMTKHLSSEGRYIGIDIIEPSIRWCQNNISIRYSNFHFYHYDVSSQIHNSSGRINVRDVSFPIKDKSVDRIILQSVFTHMFEQDIVHYLKEFHRVLNDFGKVCASFFIINNEVLEMAKGTSPTLEGLELSFRYPYGDGCYINDINSPEGAVGFTMEALERMISVSDLMLDQPIHEGSWCGRPEKPDGQDMVILKKRVPAF